MPEAGSARRGAKTGPGTALPGQRPLPPLSLYIHFPWCVRKCPYCDFHSYAGAVTAPEEYVEALLCDLDHELSWVQGRVVGSVYLGGGTPSLFPAEAIGALLAGVRERLRLAPAAEVTLEANPGTAEARRFRGFREAGVNRLSLGVQSLRDEKLEALGRIHTAEEARGAFALARAAGFGNINLDLMYGLPEDDAAGALEDLRGALALAPEQVSWYQLSLEPGTAFAARPPPLPPEAGIEAMEREGAALLAAAGYRHYEVSAYARPGYRCRHNLNYWRFGDYLGLGAGAHGKVTAQDGRVWRRVKERNPRRYMLAAGGRAAVEEERCVEPQELALEFMMNGLRLSEGVSLRSFRLRTGLDPAGLEGPLAEASRLGLIVRRGMWLRPTARGRRYLNELLCLFVPNTAGGRPRAAAVS